MKKFWVLLVLSFVFVSVSFAMNVNQIGRQAGQAVKVKNGIPVLAEQALPAPVAEYLFSGNANDTSEHANHGIVTGALLTEDRGGHENTAYIFYERPHRIKIPLNDANTFSTGSFTVSFWVKTKDDGESMKGIITNESNTTPHWGFHLVSQGKLSFFLKNQEGQYAFINAPVNDGKWHQVTGMRNAESNTMSLYMDGALVETRAGVSGDVNSGGSIWVGDSANRLFVGRVDDIRMWDQALNDTFLGAVHATGPLSPSFATREMTLQFPGIPDPIGRYMFDGNAEDSSGNENHGVVTGAEPIEDRTGNPERAYLFYERSHRIKIPLTPKNTFASGSFTASFWVKTKDQGSAMKSLLTNDSGARPQWGFKYSQQGSMVFRLSNQEGDSAFISHPINDGAWHHVTGTRNAANHTMSLYVDSALVATRPGVTGSVNSLGDIWIGDHQNRLFTGRIDDVMVWDRAFSESKMAEFHEMTAHLAQTSSFSPDADNKPEPVGQYHFDGDASDASSENNDGVVTAAHLSQDRLGNENKAYCFDERNNRIKIPLMPANTFARGSFTVSLWAKISENIYGGFHGLVTNDANKRQKWGIFYSDSGKITFVVHDKEDQHKFVSHAIDVEKWYHIIGVRNAGTNTISLYVDGHLVGTNPGVSGDVNSGNNIWIGEHTNQLFRGCIDEVVLWRRALSTQEILEMNRVNLNAPISVPLKNKNVIKKKPLNKPHVLPKI